VCESDACFGVGPTCDLIKFLDSNRDTSEGQVDIGISRRGVGSIAIKMTKGVEVACLDSGVRRIKFFNGGAFASAEGVNERARIALPCVGCRCT
jgi:uncharacterized membrane protein